MVSVGRDVAGSLVGRSVLLRPIAAMDYELLYAWSTTPPTSSTWRFRGAIPNPETFASLFWTDVTAQFAVTSSEDPAELLGLVQLFNVDASNRVGYLGLMVGPGLRRHPTSAAEALALFLPYVFEHFDLRKVYAETSEAALDGIDRVIAGWPFVEEEGRLRDHLYLDGAYHDLRVLAVHRDSFVAQSSRAARLVVPPDRGSPGRLVSFRDFTRELPTDLLPHLEPDSADGGLLLEADLGADSIGLAELVCWIEDAFNTDMGGAPPTEVLTLQDLFNWYEVMTAPKR